MTTPEPTTQGAVFDVAAVAAGMQREDAHLRQGHTRVRCVEAIDESAFRGAAGW